MSAAHRPLSAWVARVPISGGMGTVNDGDDRADARKMPLFRGEWTRRAVPLGDGSVALGLRRVDGTTFVELDDFGRPIRASFPAVETISWIELDWPRVDESVTAAFLRLAEEPFPLRFWLMERLRIEGSPPHELFAVLPWELLDRLADAVAAGLAPGGTVGELVEVRHWLTPAGRGLGGPLEQLDHGLRVGDSRLARVGAAAVLTSLRTVPVERIPWSSREALVRVATLLGEAEPLYLHQSRVVSDRLTGRSSVTTFRARLRPALEAAAGVDDVREQVEVLEDEPHRFQVVQTTAGGVRVNARVEPRRPPSGLLPRPEYIFQPLRVTPPDGGQAIRFWIALTPDGDQWTGSIQFSLPSGWSTLDADDPPVGVDELVSVDPDTLLRSVRAGTAPTAQRWLDAAESLPADHPVRIAADVFEESL